MSTARTSRLLLLLSSAVVAFVACGGAHGTPTAPALAPPASAVSALDAGVIPADLPAPAERRPTAHTYFGTVVVDDYAWLEDGKSEEVRAFVKRESAFTRTRLDAIAERPALRARVDELLSRRGPSFLQVRRASRREGLFVLVEKPPKQQPLLVWRDESAAPASERTIFDPNEVDPSGSTTIDFFVPSPDGKRVALSLSKGGSESGDVHVIDAVSGKETGDVVARVNGGTAGGSLTWNAAGTGFWYTRYPRAGERPEADIDFYQQLYFHELGVGDDRDRYVLGKDFPRIAEIELDRSDDGGAVLARVADGDGGAYEHHVLRAGTTTWRRLSSFDDELSASAFGPDGTLYLLSRKDAPRGKVVAFRPPYDKPAEERVPEGSAVIETIVATRSALYLVELVGGPSRVRRVPLDVKAEPLAREAPRPPAKGQKPRKRAAVPPPVAPSSPLRRGVASAELPLGAVVNVRDVVPVGEDLLLRVESYLEPAAWYRYKEREHRLVKTPLEQASPVDMTDAEVVRERAVSKDGTKVPLSILRPRGFVQDGRAPALLTGYGGFGVSVKPRFRPWYRAWLDAGGVIAEANLRGGGEMGEDWHRAGSLTKKQNVFDDFFAASRALVELRYTTRDRLALFGRSNGGLLVGATVTQHPDAFRAAVAGVGIYDMLRTELSPNGAFNVTEYGSVTREEQFRAMLAYSPLHNVADGVAYPAVLLVTGENDPRVDPYHSRKFLARLRAANTGARPILLRATSGVGHGMGTPLAEEIEETTDMLAFLFDELGMRMPPRPSDRAAARKVE